MTRMCATCILLLGTTLAFAQTRPAYDFSAIDSTIAAAIAAHKVPGAVVLIGHDDEVVFNHSYGERSLEPDRETMTDETIFDMASLSKSLATAPSIMLLCEQGALRLDDSVSKYLPKFGTYGKDKITISELLTHYSGLTPDLDLTTPWLGKIEAFQLADDAKLKSTPGTKFVYSDINYIVLGELVEKMSGESLGDFAARNIFTPLGMTHTRFLPPAEWTRDIAPTEYDETGRMLRGVVHDPTARRMNGVAGHAGVFSSAQDLARFAQGLLDQLHGKASNFPLSRPTLHTAVTPQQPAGGTALRGLGWDIASPYSRNRGEVFGAGSFGHTGFTGTSLWIDPESDTYVVFLSNRVHPRGGVNIVSLEGEIATEAARALHIRPVNQHGSAGTAQPVQAGIDVLEADNFAPLAALARRHQGHLRLGLLTNQTGVDHDGRRAIDILARDARAAMAGLELVTLFSPEHGVSGAQDTEHIANGIDSPTGLPIVSLYGAADAQRRPRAVDLRKLDAIVIDLQDAGVRFYTYDTLAGYFLEAAAASGIEIVVLDRPDLIGGSSVQGPVSDAGRESYTNYMPVPVRHGMTLGEFTRYANGERHIGASLTVVPMQGWTRDTWFDETGIKWINPSPNLRTMSAAILYPGIGMIETANISVGRGTDAPFEQVGAPWIDGEQLSAQLSLRSIPGVRFEPARFTPTAPYPYAGEICNGIHVTVTDRNALDSPELGMEIAAALHKLYPIELHLESVDKLMVNKMALEELLSGADPRIVISGATLERESFEARRKRYLLY
jgi:uncharacterized protein YbbC (DUF1343 family)